MNCNMKCIIVKKQKTYYLLFLIIIVSGVLLGCNSNNASDKDKKQSAISTQDSEVLIGVHFDETGETVYSSEDYQRVYLSVQGSVGNSNVDYPVAANYSSEAAVSSSPEEYYSIVVSEPIVPVDDSDNYPAKAVRSVELENYPISTTEAENIIYPTVAPLPSVTAEKTESQATFVPESSSTSNVLVNPATPIVADVGDNHLNPDKVYNFDTYRNYDNQNTSDTFVLNTSSKSMKIHHPDCADVVKIKHENYATSNLSLAELIAQGYSTCGHCFK